jgi:hypothetical protein
VSGKELCNWLISHGFEGHEDYQPYWYKKKIEAQSEMEAEGGQ